MGTSRKPIYTKLTEIDRAVEQVRDGLKAGKQYHALLDFSLAANEAVEDIDRLLDLILVAAIDQQRLAETGSVFLMNGEKAKVRLQRKRGLHDGFVQYTEFDVGEGIAGMVAKKREPILVKDCSRDLRYLPFRSSTAQLRSILAVPMIMKGEILGVICIHNSTKKEGFMPGDQLFLAELARVAAIAVKNATLYNSAILEALTDPATGLLNRRGIEAALGEYVQKAKRSRQPLSVLFIDIDNLKYFNDSFGYDTGDQVIVRVASSMRRHILARDIAGKWKEGDEFLAILPGTNFETAAVIAERIRQDVERDALPELPNEHFTISIGVAAREAGVRSHHALVKTAEEAKNRAKQEGKNRVCQATSRQRLRNVRGKRAIYNPFQP